jgi:hypothetical protein
LATAPMFHLPAIGIGLGLIIFDIRASRSAASTSEATQ